MKEKFEFEKKLKRLEEIVDILDKGELPLNEMITLYEDEIKIRAETRKYLDKAEQKVNDISRKIKEDDTEDK